MRFLHALLASALVPCLGAQQAPTPAPAPAGQDHAHAPVMPKVVTGGGNAWFDETSLDLGLFYEEEEAVGHFKFHNPRDTEQQIKHLQPSCACTKAIVKLGDRRYEVGADKLLYKVVKKGDVETKERVSHINVGPKQSGELEVHMAIHGIKGPKDATMAVQLSDDDLPLTNLRWRATGATYFVVDPPDINLNEMTWEDKREFQFRITSPLKKDFDLLSHDPLPTAMKIQYEKTMEGDRAVWTVKGTYGPGASERDSGGAITFHTNVDDKTVTARVVAFLKGPLKMEPGGFVSLGPVRKEEGKSVEVVLTPSGNFDLQVEKLEVSALRGVKEDQRKFVKFEHEKRGKQLVVRIRVLKGMAPAYINGVLKIHLNHPAAPLKEVMFNGFIR